MRLTLVISSISGGGAERAAVLLAEGFLQQGHQVSFVTFRGKETDFYKLPDQVERIALDLKKPVTLMEALWRNAQKIWILRQTICSLQPDIVISFLDRINILTLLALIQTGYPVLVSEQNNPLLASSGIWWDKLRNLTYPLAAKVVSSSKGVDDYFTWLPTTKRAVIYNPLVVVENDQNTVKLPKGAEPDKKWVIAMGRLTYQKGFDILLSAFQKIARKHLDWQLLILGEGELRSELENLREDLGLSDRVLFPGLISNPFPLLKHSKLFVLSSRFEGFGNVLIEAMACGLPVISYDCPSGPREIIRDGVDGILVPNEDKLALASAMDRLMSDSEERQSLAFCAPERAKQFSLEKIVERWELLFTGLTQKLTESNN